jgi:protocatechuate 3,4-dioxygenase beta subunit
MRRQSLLLVAAFALCVSLESQAGPASAPAGSIAGVVVDASGHPVAGAEVRAYESSKQAATARTSASGRFSLPGLHPGTVYVLLTVRPGLAPSLDGAMPSSDELRIVLKPGATVAGRLVDEHGAAIPGAVVELRRSLAASVFPEVLDAEAYRATFLRDGQGDGRFEIADVPAGWFELEARAPGRRPLYLDDVKLEPGSRRSDLGSLVLDRGRSLEVRVTDPSGKAVAGAEIWPFPRNRDQIEPANRDWDLADERGPVAVTGADGRVLLHGLETGSAPPLNLCHPGFQMAPIFPDEIDGPTVNVVMKPTAPIAGRVVDEEGKPVGGAQVFAAEVDTTPPDFSIRTPACALDPRRESVETGAEGRFVLSHLEPGVFDLSVDALGYVSATVERVQSGISEAGSEITVRLVRKPPEATSPSPEAALHATQPPAVVRGRVVGPSGELIAGALVDNGDRFDRAAVVTDASGHFAVPMSEERFEISVTRAGYAPGHFTDRQRTGSGEVGIRLGRPGAISGRLLGLRPGEAATASVEGVDSLHQQDSDAMIDRDGRYDLTGLRPGRWKVTAQVWPQEITGEVRVNAGETAKLDLRIPRVFPVRGRVIGLDGMPAPNVSVSLRRTGCNFYGWTRADGTFEIQAEAGTYSAVAEQRGLPASQAMRPVMVAGAPVGGVEIRISLQTTLVTGRLLGLDPEMRGKDVWVRLEPHGELSPAAIVDRAAGTYKIEGLTAGDWPIAASAGTLKVVRTAHLHPGESRLDLDLPFSPGDLTLTVRLEGAHLEGCYVRLTRVDSDTTLGVEVPASGIARFPGLRPGRYRLETMDTQYLSLLDERTIDLDAQREITIKLDSSL